jgi:colicin import membrane protein
MKQDKKFVKSLLISVSVHLLLLIALIWGSNYKMSKPKPTPNMMEAVVIDPSAIQKQAQQIREERNAAAKVEQERLDKLRKQSEQLEQNRKAEEEKIRRLAQEKAEAEKNSREAEQQRQLKEKQRIEEEKKAQLAEQQRKQKEEATKKAEAERLAKVKAAEAAEAERVAKEKAAKEAAEKARKAEEQRIASEKAAKEAKEKAAKEKARLAQLERERKEQEAALNDIFSGLEQESQNNSTARSRFVADEVGRYGAIYKQMIQDALLLEDSYRGKQCQVSLRLLGAGSSAIVSDVQNISGDSRLCSATKRAIAKVGSFPLPSDQSVVEQLKNIKLTVAPE